jgi:hypothetical protein
MVPMSTPMVAIPGQNARRMSGFIGDPPTDAPGTSTWWSPSQQAWMSAGRLDDSPSLESRVAELEERVECLIALIEERLPPLP